MEYLAHRGIWTNKVERNTLTALCCGLNRGYGLETDIRDLNNRLVISHDMPTDNAPLFLEQLFTYYSNGGFSSTLALNIKADGLQRELLMLLKKHNISQYFIFDMSIPDTLEYLKLKMRTFIRRSDLENLPLLESYAQGIWLDEMNEPWINESVIIEQAQKHKAVCIVSSELHGREHMSQWSKIKRALCANGVSDKLLLCTDYPDEARKFFNE